jgi:hypothetical protein
MFSGLVRGDLMEPIPLCQPLTFLVFVACFLLTITFVLSCDTFNSIKLAPAISQSRLSG